MDILPTYTVYRIQYRYFWVILFIYVVSGNIFYYVHEQFSRYYEYYSKFKNNNHNIVIQLTATLKI